MEQFLESEEGKEYKKKLLTQLEKDQKLKSKIRKRQPTNWTEPPQHTSKRPKRDSIDQLLETEFSDDQTSDDEETKAEVLPPTRDSFHSKFLELQKNVEKLPDNLAKIIAEVTMMSKDLPSAVFNKDFVIWTFGLTVEFNEETFSLPIKEVKLIPLFDASLQDEIILMQVVNINVGRYVIRLIYFIYVFLI